MIRLSLALVLLVLAGSALGADIEYTGGNLTAVNGNRYYFSADVDLADNQVITVGSGVTCEIDMQGFTAVNLNPPTADWNWIVVQAGGDLTLHDGTIDSDIGVSNAGTLRAESVTWVGATAGNAQLSISAATGSWTQLTRCYVDGNGTDNTIDASGSIRLYDSLVRGGNFFAIDQNDSGLYAVRSTILCEQNTTAGYAVECSNADTMYARSSVLTNVGGGYVVRALSTPSIVWDTASNIWHGFGGALVAYTGSSADATPDSDGGIYADPKYADAAGEDYSLTGRSPGINTGLGTRTVDLAGNTGVYDGAIDRGPYELNGPKCPAAAFSGTPLVGFAPLSVTFTDQSTESPTSWLWDFGDGVGTSTSQNPTYEYADPGTLSVTLIATNACGPDTVTIAAYVQAKDGSASGVCCVSAGLNTQATCSISTEGECFGVGWFYPDETCSPNPCGTAGEFVDPFVLRPHPMLWPDGLVEKLRVKYAAQDAPADILYAWSIIVQQADNVLAYDAPLSTLALGALTAGYVLTGNQEYADSLLSTIQAYADYVDPGTDRAAFTTQEDTRPFFAIDLLWYQIPQATREALQGQVEYVFLDGSGNILKSRRASGAYNLFLNECVWPFYALLSVYGATPDTDLLTQGMDDTWSRMMGGWVADDDNSALDWMTSFWPEWKSYQKGPGYAAKYSISALEFAYATHVSGLSTEPATSWAPMWRNGASSLYQLRLRRPGSTWGYHLGWVGNQAATFRELEMAAIELYFGSNEISTYAMTTGAYYEDLPSTQTWGPGLFLLDPDSLTATASISDQPLFVFEGMEGDTEPTQGEPGWSDMAIGRFGLTPWGNSEQTNGMMVMQGLHEQADAWNSNVPLALSLNYSGTISKRCGPYDDDASGIYPAYTSSGWNVPVPTFLNNDSATYTEDYEMVGPRQMQSGSTTDDPAGPVTDWLGAKNKYDKGDIVAAGVDSSQASTYSVYLSGSIPAWAYGDTATIGLRRQSRDVVAVLPDHVGGRALWIGRDRIRLDAAAVSPGEAIFVNWPVTTHNVAVSGGTTAATWDVPGVTANIVDHAEFSYVAVDKDTTVTSSGDVFTMHSRLYSIAGADTARVSVGRGIEWWTYTDWDDPVATGQQWEPSATTIANRTIANETGTGRVALLADSRTDADVLWVWEAHSDADEPGGIDWVTPAAVTSSDLVGVVLDSVAVLIPDDPQDGGPWSFSYSGTGVDLWFGGLPDGSYTLASIATATLEAVSGDSLLVFADVAGGSWTLQAAAGEATGACCIVDGHVCSVTTYDACQTAGGTYQGDGTACLPDPCPLFGACCLEGGECVVRLRLQCENNLGGVWTTSIDCSPNPCDQPGYCCLPGKGTCVEIAAWSCTEQGGTAGAEDSTCDPDPCSPSSGACCTDAGGGVFVCGQETEAECANLGGIFMGYIPCTPDPCEATTIGPRQRSAIWRILTGGN